MRLGHLGGRQFPADGPPVVISDRVGSDAVHPCRHPVGMLELGAVAVDAQHHLLRDVLGILAAAGTVPDEAEYACLQVARGRVRGLDER